MLSVLSASTAALLCGFCLDLALGDPRRLPHLIRAFGRLIAWGEGLLRRRFPATPSGEGLAGRWLVFGILLLCAGIPGLLLFIAYRLALPAGFLLEALLSWQLLAVKSLRQESMAVYHSLKKQDLGQARRAVSLIVSRDTARLDEAGIVRAAVETVAENTNDGVVAPLLYLTLGGGLLGCLYKAANTMDSMVGYKNSLYLHFGRAAARLDDLLSCAPARLAAALMIPACTLTGLDAAGARRIYRRDRRNHASPNAAHTEAVCAGALGVRLGGSAYYFGELYEKPTIGDPLRPLSPEDIPAACRLLYTTAGLALLLAMLFRLLLFRLLLLSGF
jgi:adenosylcobinamide-phosphate synthase